MGIARHKRAQWSSCMRRTGLRPCSLLPIHQLPCFGCCALNPEAGWFKDICLVLPFPLPFHLTLTLVFLSDEPEKRCACRQVAPLISGCSGHLKILLFPELQLASPTPVPTRRCFGFKKGKEKHKCVWFLPFKIGIMLHF